MNVDSFVKENHYNRRELLNFISLFGVVGTISFLLNGCSFSRGFMQIEGEVLLNGRRVSPEQMEGQDGVQVPSDALIRTGSLASAIFVIGRDAFLMRGNSEVELKPNLLNNFHEKYKHLKMNPLSNHVEYEYDQILYERIL